MKLAVRPSATGPYHHRDEARKGRRVNSDRRDPMLSLQRQGMAGDRRRARASYSDAQDRRRAVRCHGGEGPWVALEPVSAPVDNPRPHRRQILREPSLHLLKEAVPILESAVDEVHQISVEQISTRRKRHDVDRRCESLRIEHFEFRRTGQLSGPRRGN